MKMGLSLSIAGVIQNILFILIILLVVGALFVSLLEQKTRQQRREKQAKELARKIKEIKKEIVETKNAINKKQNILEEKSKQVIADYSEDYELLRTLDAAKMNEYAKCLIGANRYEEIALSEVSFREYEEKVEQRTMQNKKLLEDVDSLVLEGEKKFALSQVKEEISELSVDKEELSEYLLNLNSSLHHIQQKLKEDKEIFLEGGGKTVETIEIVRLKILVNALNTFFSGTIYATLEEKEDSTHKLWGNHLAYDPLTDEKRRGCFLLDEMDIDENTQFADCLGGTQSKLAIAAYQDKPGFLFGENKFDLSYYDEEKDDKVIFRNIGEFLLESGVQYTVYFQIAQKEWILKLTV